jgi:hypothetical protein
METVGVHIRRGDYINDKHTQKFHGNCGKDYYLEAIKKIKQEKKDITFIFFSDDIDWVKKNFENISSSVLYVDENKDSESWKDMLLMSYCNHQIIANSSFSWWAAWLNANPDKIVIAPQKWYNDETLSHINVVPQSWIKL